MEELAEHRRTMSQTVADVLTQLDQRLRSGQELDVRTVSTGFDVLDDVLGGGLRSGELVLVGGPPGVGKTIAALQWARSIARSGSRAVYACYEHEPTTLLVRLLALEAGEAARDDDPFARALSRLMEEGDASGQGLDAVLAGHPGGVEALRRVQSYADRLILVRASGAHTRVDELQAIIAANQQAGEPMVLLVDYLQKIPIQPEAINEAEKVTRTVEAMKDLALEHHIPVVLLSAVDADGLRANRLRLYHLRGSSAIAFESDVVLMLNSKERAVSKVHLSYDAHRARSFREWVVMSVEKNRGGPNLVDLEFRKDFQHFRFDPDGGMVTETLVDERSDESEL
jgi:replicative DNA helicase